MAIPEPKTRTNGCVGCFMAVWLLGWTVGTLLFDVQTARDFARAARTMKFPTVEGTVTRSEVRMDGEGDYLPDIAYDYEVGGKKFTGTRYSHNDVGTNLWAWHTVRDGLPVGAQVAVSYDPADPAQSVLHPGLIGFDLTSLWFATPFNIIMIGGWIWAARARCPAFDPTSSQFVTPTVTGYRVRLPGLGRAGQFAIALLAITFCGTFVWALGFSFNPPVPLAAWSYLGAVAVAVLVGAWHSPRWLEVDEAACILRLPAQPEPEVPFAAIRDVVVTPEEYKDSEGGVFRYYFCELVRTDAEPLRFATFRVPEAANALVAWLRERIGLISPPA